MPLRGAVRDFHIPLKSATTHIPVSATLVRTSVQIQRLSSEEAVTA
jgi:hypothetical protein